MTAPLFFAKGAGGRAKELEEGEGERGRGWRSHWMPEPGMEAEVRVVREVL